MGCEFSRGHLNCHVCHLMYFSCCIVNSIGDREGPAGKRGHLILMSLLAIGAERKWGSMSFFRFCRAMIRDDGDGKSSGEGFGGGLRVAWPAGWAGDSQGGAVGVVMP